MGADLLDGDVELTEFTELDVQSIKGVKQGANGFPVLLMKGLPPEEPAAKGQRDCPSCKKSFDADHKGNSCPNCGAKLPDSDDGAEKSVPEWHSPAALLVRLAAENPETSREDLFKAVAADGTVDEQPDIDGGKQAIALLAKLIQYEAQELEAGCMGEAWDIELLTGAVARVQAWLSGEAAAQMAGDESGVVMASTDDAAKAKLSAAERDKLDDSDFAIPETREYPIHDESHARNALSRVAQNGTESEKRKVRAAVHKKYPDIGDGDTSKGAVAEGEAGVQTETQETGSLSKAVEDALAKAMAPVTKELGELKAGLAKVMAAPVPGGPVLSAVRPQAAAGGDDWAAKAALYRQKADVATDPALRDGYRQLAREADTKAQAAKA